MSDDLSKDMNDKNERICKFNEEIQDKFMQFCIFIDKFTDTCINWDREQIKRLNISRLATYYYSKKLTE